MEIPLDEPDRRLLDLLQQDAKLSVQELARGAGMSASPAWRRVRRLEEQGLIRGYVALLDPAGLGLHVAAYVHVCLLDHTEETIRRFDEFVQREEQVLECATITGSDDFILRVVARDPEGLEQFLMRRLLSLGIVRSTTTNFVLRQTKMTTRLPLT